MTEAQPIERLIRQKDVDCEALEIEPPLFICAPMVRYSKQPFRKLVKRYGCDLAYTPMIYAENFVASELCRANEFSTDDDDWPIIQFAANRGVDFANAAELVYGQVKGIDLNCGCPKRDVRAAGYGSSLLKDPALIADIVKQTRARISDPEFTCSVKIRIDYPLERTLDLCRQVQAAGVSHLAVHGRTVDMRGEMPDYKAIALIKSALDIPVYANGGCTTYDAALCVAQTTGADGVMVAEGLLSNPALFAGHDRTPVQCVRDWIHIATSLDTHFILFHRHTAFMAHSLMNKQQRCEFATLKTMPDAIAYFNNIIANKA